MSMVTLVSGGLDSTLMALLAKEEGIAQNPLFVDYGQLCVNREWEACTRLMVRFGIGAPARMDLSGYGRLISSGLTSRGRDVFLDAFLPGRNLLLLLAGAAYASEMSAADVAIGLLNEESRLFFDQSSEFLERAQALLSACIQRTLRVVAPLMSLDKADVIRLAGFKGITETYSCHSGDATPCGKCVSCREVLGTTLGQGGA